MRSTGGADADVSESQSAATLSTINGHLTLLLPAHKENAPRLRLLNRKE
jgi:hypothetical protein